jgi:hypothetical protein
MKIQSFTKNTVLEVKQELEAAISSICEKYGLQSSTLGSISFADSHFTTGKITISVRKEKSSEVDLSSLIGKRYKMGQRIFTIESSNIDGTLSAITNRGVRYRIRPEQLETMINL